MHTSKRVMELCVRLSSLLLLSLKYIQSIQMLILLLLFLCQMTLKFEILLVVPLDVTDIDIDIDVDIDIDTDEFNDTNNFFVFVCMSLA